MNTGTKIRTILFAIACVNQAIASVGDVDFGSHVVNVVYKVISTTLTIIVGAIALYYNNDFTEEACIGTGVTRQLKAEKEAGYIGDYFFDEGEETEDEEEDEEEENNEQEDLEAGGQPLGE